MPAAKVVQLEARAFRVGSQLDLAAAFAGGLLLTGEPGNPVRVPIDSEVDCPLMWTAEDDGVWIGVELTEVEGVVLSGSIWIEQK